MYLFLLFFTSLILIASKASTLGIRLSDSNIYFYTGWLLLQGKLLYKDIFFTNLPLFPYISAFYVFLFRDITLYYFTSVIEIILTAFLIYFSILKKYQNEIISLIGGMLYLTSFIILTTSDHQSGVFLASLCGVAAYLAYLHKKFILTGIFLGCCVCIKAYYIPIPLAFLIVVFIKERAHFIHILMGFLMTILVILLPSFIWARQQLFNDVIQYSLLRGQGLSKLNILWFFIKHDIVLDVLFLSLFLRFRKNLLLSTITLLSSLLILFYQDIYYLYLNLLVPFLILSIGDSINIIKTMTWKFTIPTIITLLILFQMYNVYFYFSNYVHVNEVSSIEDIVETIQKNKPDYLYGENELTPAISYLTHIPLLNKQIDTNANIFNKGILNKDTFTQKVLSTKTIVVSHGVDYPLQGIEERLVTDIMNSDIIKKRCRLLLSTPIRSEDEINRVTLFRCY